MPVDSLGRAAGRTAFVGIHEDDTIEHPVGWLGREFIPPLKPGERAEKVLERIHKLAEPWGKGGVYVSYKPPPREVKAGKWAGVHREIGEWLRENPWAGVIVHHEPEGGQDRLDGATFRAMFTRARDEIKEGWPDARVVYCAMGYQWRKGGDAAKRPAEWKRVVADEYLCDVYSGQNDRNGSFPLDTILPKHPSYVGWFDQIVRPHLEKGQKVTYGLGERGFLRGDDPGDRLRAATIRRERAWLDTVFDRYSASHQAIDLPPSVYLAWSSRGWENEPGWLLTGDARVAMNELLEDFAEHVR